MAFLKHIGRHANDKAIILYRKVPADEQNGVKTYESHMCYLVYTEKLPRVYHDAVIKLLESREGQEAKEFSDILFRNLLPDGRKLLQTLFQENHVRKVQTIQVIMTPTLKDNIRLDKLNDMLDKIEAGGQAAQEMSNLDESAGMGKSAQAKKNARAQEVYKLPEIVEAQNFAGGGALSNADIARDLLSQSAKMESQAQGLLAESKRLAVEAASLAPIKATKTVSTKKIVKKTTKAISAKGVNKKALKVA